MRLRGRAVTAVPVAVIFGVPLVAWLVLNAGCAHPPAAPPDVVRSFAIDVARGQWERAYGLMSDDYKRRVSLAKFRAEIEDGGPAVNADALSLSREGFGGPARATVEARGGERFMLLLDGDAWRLEEQPLAPFGQQSPRAALRTLVRAVERRRYDVVLRLVPARHRPSVTVQALRAYWEGGGMGLQTGLIEVLRAHINAPIVDLGGEAYMPYGPVRAAGAKVAPGAEGSSGSKGATSGEGEVRFVLEEGVWRIDDVR